MCYFSKCSDWRTIKKEKKEKKERTILDKRTIFSCTLHTLRQCRSTCRTREIQEVRLWWWSSCMQRKLSLRQWECCSLPIFSLAGRLSLVGIIKLWAGGVAPTKESSYSSITDLIATKMGKSYRSLLFHLFGKNKRKVWHIKEEEMWTQF